MYIFSGLIVWDSIAGGRGKDVSALLALLDEAPTPEVISSTRVALKVIWAQAFLTFVAYYTLKMAVLLLIRRIFSTDPYRKVSTVLIIASTLWFIAVEVADIVHCLPIGFFWDRSIPGHCFNFNLFNLISGILDIVLDASILALPIWAVARTQMPLQKRLLVCGIFLFGGFAIITNILRLSYTYQPDAQYVRLAGAELWFNIHI
ncbi:hypothetical protein F5Y17DRAFT_443969 [Xylariaceae sp. FL0594]|nr:hypothetical protein F5Y17DRAFT_443969 [Xylariaceae sp. FL0594]